MDKATKRQAAILWMVITMVTAGILARNIGQPHPQVYFSWDEAHYGATALEMVETGVRSDRRVFPENFYERGDMAVGYPSILPFFQYPTVYVLGFTRPALRLPGLTLYVMGSLVLLAVWWRMGAGLVAAAAILAAYLLSPWMSLAATTARAEMVSVFFILLACLPAWSLRERPWLGFGLAGFCAGVASYNHPSFLGTACVPFLFALQSAKVPWRLLPLVRSAALYAAGAILAVGLLFGVLVLPYFDQWHEQFWLNIQAEDNAFYAGKEFHLLTALVGLKHLFSTFGSAYANWYLLVALLCAGLLRTTVHFWIAVVWLAASMLYLDVKTTMNLQHCVTLAAGIPVLALLSGPPRFQLFERPLAGWLLLVFVAAQVPWNAWRATRQTEASLAFAEREALISRQLDVLPDARAVAGGDETTFPALSRGLRFFYAKPKWAFSPERTAEFFRLAEEQANYFVSDKGEVSSAKPPAY